MSEDLHKYRDFFKEKLENHESEVPENLFDALMNKRNQTDTPPSEKAYNAFFQEKLSNFESDVPENLFSKLLREREGTDESVSDASIRERILDHETPVAQHIFEEMMVERDRRRRALIWRSAAALLLLLTAYFLYVNKDEKNKTEINTPLSTELEKTQALQKSIDNQSNKATKITVSEGEWAVDSKVSNNSSTVLAENENSLAINKKSIITNQTKNNPSPTNHSPVSNKLKNSHNTVSNSAHSITEHTAIQQVIIPSTSYSLNSTVAAVETPINNSNVEQGASQTVGDRFDEKVKTVSDAQRLISSSNLPEFDHLAIFQIKNIAVPNNKKENPCAPDPNMGCPTFGQKRRSGGEKSIYIDVFGAPEYAFRRLTENLPEMTTYLRVRDSVESPWYAFSAGTRVSVVFKNGLSLRTGLTYGQINETAVFDSLGIGKKNILEEYIPRTGGGVDTIRKTEIVSGIFRSTYYNRYRSIDIPLQIGMEFPLNDYWTFSVNGGVNFNLKAWRKADIVNEKGTRTNLTSGFGVENPVFRNSLGISVLGSMSAYRQLTNQLQLVIEPSVKYALQPITRSDFALKQSYTNIGLILGLRYRL
ncbi:MAG: hypothetical protein JNL70_03760 [Saprospiraceae bacterium]|nr:hypothetical protein [Saprospiraceae bacterium]